MVQLETMNPTTMLSASLLSLIESKNEKESEIAEKYLLALANMHEQDSAKITTTISLARTYAAIVYANGTKYIEPNYYKAYWTLKSGAMSWSLVYSALDAYFGGKMYEQLDDKTISRERMAYELMGKIEALTAKGLPDGFDLFRNSEVTKLLIKFDYNVDELLGWYQQQKNK